MRIKEIFDQNGGVVFIIFLLCVISTVFPYIGGYGSAMEEILKGSETEISLRSPYIAHICLAASAILFPAIVEEIIDIRNFGFCDWAAERIVFLLIMFCLFFGQYVASFFSIYASLFSVLLIVRAWAFASISFYVMHRLNGQFFNTYAVISFAALAYTSLILSICELMAFSGDTLKTVAGILRALSSAGYALYFTIFLIKCTITWLRSRLSLPDWLHSLDQSTQYSVFVSMYVTFISVVHVLFRFILNKDLGMLNLSIKFIISFYLVLIFSNVSLVVVAYRHVRIKSAHLEVELQKKQTFIRYISHEMRTPLSIIQTGLDVLEDEIGSKQPRSTLQSTVTDLRQPCQDCLVILNDLLSYEKLDAGIMHIECNEQDPSVFLTSTVRLFIVSARKKEIDLTVQSDVTIGSCTVDVDEKKMGQVFQNLLSNSIKFTPIGGSVAVRIFIAADQLRVEVKDTGTGLTEENQRKLFDRVIQFHAKVQQGGGGSGLGLWISKKIMDLHGGSIGVSSEGEGKGSLFFFTLPMKRCAELQVVNIPDEEPSLGVVDFEPMPQGPLMQAPLRTSHHYRNARAGESGRSSEVNVCDPSCIVSAKEPLLRILVVDDSGLIRKFMIKKLEKEGFKCYQADDGDIAVELVQASLSGNEGDVRYDLITLDNMMPRMRGPECAERLRKIGYTGHIVGVTGNALDVDVRDFISHGANAVIPKPFELELLKRYLIDYNLIKDEKTDSKIEVKRSFSDVLFRVNSRIHADG